MEVAKQPERPPTSNWHARIDVLPPAVARRDSCKTIVKEVKLCTKWKFGQEVML